MTRCDPFWFGSHAPRASVAWAKACSSTRERGMEARVCAEQRLAVCCASVESLRRNPICHYNMAPADVHTQKQSVIVTSMQALSAVKGRSTREMA